ncbi:hypothetical protein [Pedobacter sp. Bi36]|uniref:hypothetical protein n=1 Tax=Pedobacter sp. Bi36 TaxID=2822352 RepID=UPI001E60D240|nr:hypothetical protein [Pedobacter sp. Bi36]
MKYNGKNNNNGHRYIIVPALATGKVNSPFPKNIFMTLNSPKAIKTIIANITQNIDTNGIDLSLS